MKTTGLPLTDVPEIDATVALAFTTEPVVHAVPPFVESK
jgi:hypothetical protein